MAKKQSSFVVSANRTDDGATVYRGEGGEWRLQLAEAQVHGDDAAAQAALAMAQREERWVCDPYVIGVGLDASGKPLPLTARETIRATGPTCRVRRPDPRLNA